MTSTHVWKWCVYIFLFMVQLPNVVRFYVRKTSFVRRNKRSVHTKVSWYLFFPKMSPVLIPHNKTVWDQQRKKGNRPSNPFVGIIAIIVITEGNPTISDEGWLWIFCGVTGRSFTTVCQSSPKCGTENPNPSIEPDLYKFILNVLKVFIRFSWNPAQNLILSSIFMTHLTKRTCNNPHLLNPITQLCSLSDWYPKEKYEPSEEDH